MDLPKFKYHPDPVATGSFEERAITCVSCGERRAFVYIGPVYADADLDDSICPWCIGSGLAREKFDAEFTDLAAIGDYDPTVSVPVEVREEIAFRTPGFNGWQQERWLVHCGDACAFLGPAGKAELQELGAPGLIDSLRLDLQMNNEQFREYFEQLDRRSGPTAYVFRCIHCGKYLGYSDCD